jgi:hypothetical protein
LSALCPHYVAIELAAPVQQVAALARDQHGCRFLQRKFEEGGAAAVETVFEEVLDQLVDLMVDPFGNYLVQKLLDICSDEQRLRMLQAVAQRGDQEVSSPRAPCLRPSRASIHERICKRARSCLYQSPGCA